MGPKVLLCQLTVAKTLPHGSIIHAAPYEFLDVGGCVPTCAAARIYDCVSIARARSSGSSRTTRREDNQFGRTRDYGGDGGRLTPMCHAGLCSEC